MSASTSNTEPREFFIRMQVTEASLVVEAALFFTEDVDRLVRWLESNKDVLQTGEAARQPDQGGQK